LLVGAAAQEEGEVLGHDFCIVLAALGVGWLGCSMRLGALCRSDRRRAKQYLDRCRRLARDAHRVVDGSIGHLTLVVGRRVTRRFGRRVDALDRRLADLAQEVGLLQQRDYADMAAEDRLALMMELDEPSTVALRREASNGDS
jgi:hypothetical protein